MQTIELKTLVAHLGAAVGEAQRLAAERYEGQVERLRRRDAEGRTEVLSWFYTIKDAGGDETREVRLPLVTLRPFLRSQVAEFSMEFDGVIEPIPPEEGGGNVGEERSPVRVGIRRRDGLRRFWPWPGLLPWRGRFQKILIRLKGGQPGECEVYADGRQVTHIADDTEESR